MKIQLATAVLFSAAMASASAQSISGPMPGFAVDSTGATSVRLKWTDAMSVFGSPFPEYDVRYLALSQITTPASPSSAANSAFAAQWDTDGIPVDTEPYPTGSGGTVTCNVGGLSMGTTYYFRITALWQSEPNPDLEPFGESRYGLVSAVTLLDASLPSKVTGLVRAGGSDSVLRLQWTSPREDDGDVASGPVTRYEIFYGPASLAGEITVAKVGLVTRVQADLVSAPGLLETFELGGLEGSTEYSIAVRGVDDAGQPGPLSATLVAETGAAPAKSEGRGLGCSNAAAGGLALIPAFALWILLTSRPGNRTLVG